MLYELVDEAYTFAVAIHRWAAALLAELDLTEPLADALWHLDSADGPRLLAADEQAAAKPAKR